ncbi:MAG: arylsulfatase [Gammaproteobacteria bacterium]|nr:arylsulfatase [Gammaproteobacteria bacterium]
MHEAIVKLAKPVCAKTVTLLLISSLAGCNQPEATKADGVGEAEPVGRPNILLIVADDLGFSDLGAYGGEISTPTLDKLASSGGLQLTNFHAAPTCSPTRSMIMSGTYNHQAGLGAMAEWVADNQRDQPGYEGYLNDRVAPLPALLSDAGYYTFMAGKWHLGMHPEHWPNTRGFEDSFAMLPGAGNHFSDKGWNPRLPVIPYVENGKPADLPDDFYSTRFYTDKAIEFLSRARHESGRPFFGYVAYTAPHWPLQVPEEYSDKYRGRYSAGYQAIRSQRLKRMVDAGLFPEEVQVKGLSECRPSWDALTAEERERQARAMELYAGMVDALDENIGRLLNHLEQIGERDNTVVIFISDNGADARPENGLGGENAFLSEHFDNSLENLGTESSFVSYGGAWAEVGSAPFSLHKGMTTEGGIRVPAIISFPRVAKVSGISHEFMSVMDLLPTFLEIAGAKHPLETYRGREVLPVTGKSLVPFLKGKADKVHEVPLYGFSVHRRHGLQYGDLKLVRLPPPEGNGEWQLFDLRTDPGESKNLADAMPEALDDMVARWEAFVRQTGIIVAEPGARAPNECTVN